MKKTLIAVAVVLAAGMMSSCNDTNYCYQVTQTYTLLGTEISHTYNWWGTKNDLKAYEQSLKDAATTLGAAENTVTISSTRTSKSQDECK